MSEEIEACKQPSRLEAITRITALDGCMSRKNFWTYTGRIFLIYLLLVLVLLYVMIEQSCPDIILPVAGGLFGLCVMLIAPAAVRRFHDSGKSAAGVFLLLMICFVICTLPFMFLALMLETGSVSLGGISEKNAQKALEALEALFGDASAFLDFIFACCLAGFALLFGVICNCFLHCCKPTKAENNPYAEDLAAEAAKSYSGTFHVSRDLLWLIWTIGYIIQFSAAMFSDSGKLILALAAIKTFIFCTAAIGRLRETGKIAFAPVVLAVEIFSAFNTYIGENTVDPTVCLILLCVFFCLQLFSLYLLLQPSSAIVQRRKQAIEESNETGKE